MLKKPQALIQVALLNAQDLLSTDQRDVLNLTKKNPWLAAMGLDPELQFPDWVATLVERQLLDAEDFISALKIAHCQRRWQRLLGRALVKYLLIDSAGDEIIQSGHLKTQENGALRWISRNLEPSQAPHQSFIAFGYEGYIAQPSINISHSGSWVAVALSFIDFPLGIDVQAIDTKVSFLKIAQRVFDEDERLLCQTTSHPREFFFDRWTLKEAAVKASQEGLAQGLKYLKIVKINDEKHEIYDLRQKRPAWQGRLIHSLERHDQVALSIVAGLDEATENSRLTTVENFYQYREISVEQLLSN